MKVNNKNLTFKVFIYYLLYYLFICITQMVSTASAAGYNRDKHSHALLLHFTLHCNLFHFFYFHYQRQLADSGDRV